MIYFEDLLEPSSLSSSISILEKDYEDAIRSKGELDERLFIDEDDSLLGSGSLSGGAMSITGVKVYKSINCFVKTVGKYANMIELSLFLLSLCRGKLIQ